MRSLNAIAAAALMLAACGSGNETAPPENGAGDAPPAPAGEQAAARWELASGGEGTALVLFASPGEAALRLFCPAGRSELLVNVPAFRPVGSEERLSFGSGGEVVALVADTRGDPQRGGVSATGAVPEQLPALLGGPVAVNYGAQNSGPHPAPPAELVRDFAAACRGRPATPPGPGPVERPGGEVPSRPSGTVSACRLQEGTRLDNPPLRAIGTEPFWNARTEGRCVTYSHPEDQSGTRVWTTYRAGAGGGGTWSGALDGRLFELTVRPRPGCSDGMSDRRYPFEAELKVWGEVRRGCAEPG